MTSFWLGSGWQIVGKQSSGVGTARGRDLPMSGGRVVMWICSFGEPRRRGLSALVSPGVTAVKSEISREHSLGRGAGMVTQH